MNKIIIFIISISFLSPLFAINITKQEVIDKRYAIKLGVYKKLENAKRVAKKFADVPTFISKRNGKYGVRHHSFIVNFKSKEEANHKLKEVKKEIKDAFVIFKKMRNNKEIKIKTQTKSNIITQVYNETNLTLPLPTKVTTATKDLNKSSKKERVDIKVLDQSFEQLKNGLTLEEALLKALNRSTKVLSAKEKVIQAKRKLDQKKAGYKPRIVLYATGGQSYQHIKGEDGLEHNYPNGSAELSLTQNIYSGGKVSNGVKKEQQNLRAATYKFRSLVEEEIINVIDSYLGIIYEQKSILTNRENMKELKKILEIVTIKEQSGASTKGDLNYIKSNVENASTALLKTESKYQNAISYYEYFVGKIDDNNSPIQENFKFVIEDKNTTLLKMKTHNAKIETIKAQLQAQKYDLQMKKAPFRPNLDLILSAKQKRTKSESEPHEDRANAVLSLNYNLYNGGKDKAALLSSKSKISELRYKLIDLQESTIFNTILMYDNMSNSKKSLFHIKKEVSANKKVTESYWSAFKYKEQDIQALLLAQRALNRSQLDEIKEHRNYALDYFKLLAQTGGLLEATNLENFTNPDKMVQETSSTLW